MAGLCFQSMLAGCLLIVAAAGAEIRLHTPLQSDHKAFAAFMREHDRAYSKGTAEYDHRLALFSLRLNKAAQQNARPDRLWTAGVGPLADYSKDELQQLRGWFGSASSTRGHGGQMQRTGMFLAQTGSRESAAKKALPEEFLNWTKLSSLSATLDQGQCGSCWALAAATILDAHAEIHKSAQRSFSVQELVSCVPNPRNCGGSGGCQGATVELALNYALNAHMQTDDQYPYLGGDGICVKDSSAAVAMQVSSNHVQEDITQVGAHEAGMLSSGMHGWERLPENKAEPMLRALYERGPVGVSVAADGWQMYSDGIFDACDKDAVIDHAVTLIGYGKDPSLNNQKFWLIQNSWGNSWGENGRIRLLREDDDEAHCGTDRQPEAGSGCDGGPAAVKVCGMCGVLYDTTVPHFGAKLE
eukprot:CAMPEP_0115112902 /NCGR_PEP_ID=MMETSP0227-20121206/40976_1 /TAXON_ID=89957 /ORGANISM="Polarella glacialis, Strain CCMP 1383" /LENGTH=413 /DNA_ID=CAMNT_0002512677 /DNA_START=131 /DNA_END=1372 /DNA_ORIENTATION=-